MELSVYNIKGEDTGRKVALNDSVFGIEPNDHAIYLDVKQYLANQRQGTHKAKQRSEMSGSTRKLGRQKGGGGARRGSIPTWSKTFKDKYKSKIIPLLGGSKLLMCLVRGACSRFLVTGYEKDL
jgi:ribosomal protein L4